MENSKMNEAEKLYKVEETKIETAGVSGVAYQVLLVNIKSPINQLALER